jgi:pyruvate kinase
MAKNIRRAQRELSRRCRILMDLSGPKLRTGALEPGPRVLRWRPTRDALGQATSPARVWLTPGDKPQAPEMSAPVLPIVGDGLALLNVGDVIEFDDARQRRRELKVVSRVGANLWAEADRTAYVTPGVELRRAGEEKENRTVIGVVGELPPTEKPISLSYGDVLVLTAEPTPGAGAKFDADGKQIEKPHIACTLPEIFGDVRAGERIWLDDGRIGGVIEAVSPGEIQVRIVRCKPTGDKLRADKGINLPDSRLRVKGLTKQDGEDLKFIVKHADLVALSFLRTPEDVRELQVRLEKLGAGKLGIMLKIETRQALEGLPKILLAAMRSHPIGIMIARGDLAVECGYERLAEAQEEILWLCEASHIPVVWATQVLENLTKQGLPSRAEITDAAMSVRAECVMLNKGPYILESLRVLDDIMRRMEAIQQKKSPLLGRLVTSEIDN